MSQIGPNRERRSVRSIKKTPKRIQLDADDDAERVAAEEAALAKQQCNEATAQAKASRAEECERIGALQVQAEAELDGADATVQMMYGPEDLPGSDSDDPNYRLIRKIIHLTGKNYAGQGLTTKELQDILDNPTSDVTLSEGDPRSNQSDNQPTFAAFYPGLTFSTSQTPTPKPKSSSAPKPFLWPLIATTAPSKHARQHSTDTSPEKRRRVLPVSNSPPPASQSHASPQLGSWKGSAVPAEATSEFSPLTRTDQSTVYGGTPTRPLKPPPPPRKRPAPLVQTDTTTVMGGTPRQPLKPKRPSTGTSLRILGSHSQPPALPTSAKRPSAAPSTAANQLGDPSSLSSPLRPQHMGRGVLSGSNSTPSRPESPSPSMHGSPGVGDSGHPTAPQAGLAPRNPPPPPKRPTPTTAAQESPLTTTSASHTRPPPPPSRSGAELEAEYNQVRDELKAALEAYKSLTNGLEKSTPLLPKAVAMLKKVRALRERFGELIRLTKDASTNPIQPTGRSPPANPTAQNPERGRIPSNSNTTHATNTMPSSTPSHATKQPSQNTTSGRSPAMQHAAPNDKRRLMNRRVPPEERDDGEGEGEGDGDGDGDSYGDGDGDREEGGDGEGDGDGDGDAEYDGHGHGGGREDDGEGEGEDDDRVGIGRGRRARTARSEREKANKPSLSDISPEVGEVLKVAKLHALATLLSRGMFDYVSTDAGPKLIEEADVYKEAWVTACQELKVARRYCSIFGKWLRQRHSEYINSSSKIIKIIVDRYLKFPNKKLRQNMNISKAQIEEGCHREPNGYAFHSPLLRQAIHSLLFDSKHPYGVTHEEMFRCIPPRLIAYTCAIIHYVINGYRHGPWMNDRMNATTQGAFFRQFLKEYEQEENQNADTKAYGERVDFDAQKVVKEPMSPAKGTWDPEMECDMDMD